MSLASEHVQIPERDTALKRLQAGKSIDIVGRHGKTKLLLDLAGSVDGAIVIRVPAAPDQVPYLLLHMGAACGPEVLRQIASCVSRRADDPSEALDKLGRAIGKRPLFVDDVDAIGVRGIDPELRPAMKTATTALRHWFAQRARVRTYSQSRSPESDVRPTPTVATAMVSTWDRVGRDIDSFVLALLRERLAAGDAEDERSWDPKEIVLDVWSALPEALQELVARLAVHGRPVARADWEALQLSEPSALEEAIQVGLVENGRDLVWLPKPWYVHCPAVASPRHAAGLHTALATAFAGHVLGKDAYLVKPLFALEAHRHFAAVPDIDRAREFARFGAATLLDTARRLSLAARNEPALFAEAARTYEVVLQLDDESQKTGGKLGDQPVAYARFYRHYNRYRAGLESRSETIAGYAEALEGWPENALFWSRYMGALFIDGRYTEATASMVEAYIRVPEHPNRDHLLRVRTTERLLRRGVIDGALLAWNEHEPGLLEAGTESRLHQALERGFLTDRLRGRGDAVVFREPQQVRFARTSSAWIARALDVAGHGAYPVAAYHELHETVRREVERLHRTLTHQLDASDRMRKQTILGVVDLAASRLLRLASGTTWVFGRLTDDPVGLVFKTDDDQSFDLAIADAPAMTAEATYRFARVKTGDAGEPIGPVIEIDAPLGTDPAVVWEQWKKRIAGDA